MPGIQQFYARHLTGIQQFNDCMDREVVGSDVRCIMCVLLIIELSDRTGRQQDRTGERNPNQMMRRGVVAILPVDEADATECFGHGR